MLELAEAVMRLKENFRKQKLTEVIPLSKSYGRVAAFDIPSPINVPNFSKSAMDGYALFAEDTMAAKQEKPITLSAIGSVYAGDDPSSINAARNTCVRITTGAKIPQGYNAVIKQENTTNNDSKQITVFTEVVPGENYIEKGEDLVAGELIIQAGTILDSENIGTLAAVGLTTLTVLKKIRVGLIATGSELLSPGERLTAGKLYNSTVYTLASYIERYNGTIVFQEKCPDDPICFSQILKQYAGKFDVVLTTGGVSIGDKDFLPQGIKVLGAEEIFHFIKMKPGTPVMASRWQDTIILSLSGNPFASLMNFHLFYWPLLAYFFQNKQFLLKEYDAEIASGYRKKSKLTCYIRAKLNNGKVTLPAKKKHLATGSYDCIVVQPENKKLEPNCFVKTYLLP
ncbi:molybdopterin molybdotransferase MoeA [Tetragenococcus halophilus]|uniref:Molybdopterin molybdenumtransferase n=1 Tax=Tetragenococcus halophilus TaxID=51669 RepID=A0AB37D5M2_TETHA|nr:molybdopterin molybdotransferase MoeA [Tetragenococcus halophilus]MDN6112006.1 molybdopterin molybdotransferase MoeA [Tetragenococcus halophilus]MDN6568278.1 molybdopterin molybdotransferase MoeA [Tetragenococcus halophilus]MDN6726582.1 molybdopterin molybdotransferase MoeA [Tetragenococcus halophilus]QGP76444.1 molybdopterin molybdenumtransferase MoeA [Tetragenococcus halophilus]GMG67618.1 molybdopterin molybdotransferase MoeA [Tetragenococcus halophilus]